MSFDLGSINLWAVLVAAVATFLLGGAWYGAVFAKPWVKLHGYTDEQIGRMQNSQMRNFAIFMAGDLIMATIISLLTASLGVASAGGGALLGFSLWLGIAATIGASKNAANDKPLGAYLIDTGHELACLVVMGLIIGAWR